MKIPTPYRNPGFYVFLLTLLALGMMVFLNGCEVIKKSQTKKEEKITAAAADSGAVSKKSTSDTKGSEYGRETIIFQPALRDCTINHIYPASPSVIYREWGSQQEEKKTDSYDSTWDKKFAMLLQAIASKETEKETSVLNAWQIIAIGIGAGLFGAILIVVFIKILKR